VFLPELFATVVIGLSCYRAILWTMMQPLLVVLTLAAAKLREGEVTELLPGEDRLTFKLRTKRIESGQKPKRVHKADGFRPNGIEDLFQLYFPNDPESTPKHIVCTDQRMVVNAGGAREPPRKFTMDDPVPVSHWMDRNDRDNLWMYLMPNGTDDSLWYVPNRTIQFNDFQDAMDYIGEPWVAPHNNNGVSKMELMKPLTERLRLEEFDTLMFAKHLDGWTACGLECCPETTDNRHPQSWLVHEIVSLKAPKSHTMDAYEDTNTCPANPLLRRGPVTTEPYCTCEVYEAGDNAAASVHAARKEHRFIIC
jgi:hypothetical protein